MIEAELKSEREHRVRPVFVPMALVVLTLVLLMGFQSLQLIRDRDLLGTRYEAQQAPLEEVEKVGQQLQATLGREDRRRDADAERAERETPEPRVAQVGC